MKLINPVDVRAKLMAHDLYTIEQIAERLNMSSNTISRVMRGLPARAGTIVAIANILGEPPSAIAELAKEN